DPARIREAIVEAVQRTLESGRIDWQRKFSAPIPTAGAISAATSVPIEGASSRGSPPIERPIPSAPEISARSLSRQSDVVEASMSTAPEQPSLPHSVFGSRADSPIRPQPIVPPPYLEPGPAPKDDLQFQIIGVLNRLYVLMENSEGLVLVDQHAAHERILFEELRRRMEEQGVPSQRILLPQIFSLPPR